MPDVTSIKKYVLIIEDHPNWADTLSQVMLKIDPTLEILKATTATQALDYINSYHDRLDLVTIDLGLPATAGDSRSSETNGIDLLRTLLAQRPTLNLLVNTSSDPKKLSGLKSAIIEHQAGFVFIHKGTQIDSDLTLEKIKTAISGDTDRRDIKSTLGDFPMKPKWLEAVRLASEGHDNAEISQKMRPSEKPHKNHARTVNNYLSNAGTVLGIYTEDGGDFRTRVIIAARDARLIE